MKDIKDQEISLKKEEDLIVVYKNDRRALRLPYGAAHEFVQGLKGEIDDLIVASDDDGTPIQVFFKEGHTHVHRGKREVFVLRPLYAQALGEGIILLMQMPRAEEAIDLEVLKEARP